MAGIFGRMGTPRGPMLLTKGFNNIHLGKKKVFACRIANREDTDQTASVHGLHCLSRHFWQAARMVSPRGTMLLTKGFDNITR